MGHAGTDLLYYYSELCSQAKKDQTLNILGITAERLRKTKCTICNIKGDS